MISGFMRLYSFFSMANGCGSPAGGTAFENPRTLTINPASYSYQVHPPGYVARRVGLLIRNDAFKKLPIKQTQSYPPSLFTTE